MQKLDYLRETASQTAGPYVHIGLAPGAAGFDIYENELGWSLAGPNTKGERITIKGRVIDGMGAPVKDVLLEAWQANSKGIYAHPEHPGTTEDDFRGWGRIITDFDTGEWRLDTIKPGGATGADGKRHAPHITLWLVARGINIGLNTRLYFEDEPGNAEDAVLNGIEWENRRATLIAHREDSPDGTVYRFDIHLQGPQETVFFDI